MTRSVPYDPSIEVGVRGQVTCTITAPQDDGDGDAALGGGDIGAQVDTLTLVLVGVVGLMLAAVALAMIARNAGRKAALGPGEREVVQRGFQRRRRAPPRVDQLLRGTGSTRRSEGTRLDRPRRGRSGASMAAVRQQQAEAQRSAMPSMPDLDRSDRGHGAPTHRRRRGRAAQPTLRLNRAQPWLHSPREHRPA